MFMTLNFKLFGFGTSETSLCRKHGNWQTFGGNFLSKSCIKQIFQSVCCILATYTYETYWGLKQVIFKRNVDSIETSGVFAYLFWREMIRKKLSFILLDMIGLGRIIKKKCKSILRWAFILQFYYEGFLFDFKEAIQQNTDQKLAFSCDTWRNRKSCLSFWKCSEMWTR